MPRYIKFEHLDPLLQAKINGIASSGDNPFDLSKYFEKGVDKVQLSDLGKTVTSNLDDRAKQITDLLSTYYHQGSVISINDIPSELKNEIQTNSDKIATVAANLESVADVSKITALENQVQTNTDSITAFKIEQATTNQSMKNDILTNANTITKNKAITDSNTSNIASIRQDLSGYRLINTKINYQDFDSDVDNKFISMQSSIDTINKKSYIEKISSHTPGCIMISNDTGYSCLNTVYRDAFGYSTNEISYAISRRMKKIVDLRNMTILTSSLNDWNYNEAIKYSLVQDATINSSSATVLSGYKRISILPSGSDTFYTVSPSEKTTVSGNKIIITVPSTDTVPCILSFGFYGTNIHINGTTATSSSVGKIGFMIDRDPVLYTIDPTTESSIDMAYIFGIDGLSIGRHNISLYVYPNASITINAQVDINESNSDILKIADIPNSSIFDSFRFDKENNWQNKPSTYTNIVINNSDFIDNKTMTADQIYINRLAFSPVTDCLTNILLQSTIFGSIYCISQFGDVSVIQQNERFEVSLNSGSTSTISINNVMLKHIGVFIYDETNNNYVPAVLNTNYSITFTNNSITIKNLNATATSYVICAS